MRYSLWPFLPHPYLSPFFLAPSSFHFCYASVEFLCIFSRASTFFTRSSCASILFFSLTRLFLKKILFYLCPAEEDLFPASLRGTFFFYPVGHSMTTSSSLRRTYIYLILWPDKKKMTGTPASEWCHTARAWPREMSLGPQVTTPKSSIISNWLIYTRWFA